MGKPWQIERPWRDESHPKCVLARPGMPLPREYECDRHGRYTSRVDGASVETRLRDHFSRHPEGIAAAYLFGSFGRGTADVRSDVDVAALYSEHPPSTLDSPALALENDLERLIGRSVQVVVLNSAPVDLVHRVLRDGRLVFEGDRSARIAFEVKSRNEYFDLLPFLRRYRKLERPA